MRFKANCPALKRIGKCSSHYCRAAARRAPKIPDEKLEEFLAVVKLIRDISIPVEQRHENIKPLLEKYKDVNYRSSSSIHCYYYYQSKWSIRPIEFQLKLVESVKQLIVLHDYTMDLINKSSPKVGHIQRKAFISTNLLFLKVKEVYLKLYALAVDKHFALMSENEQDAVMDKIYGTLNIAEQKEAEKVEEEHERKAKELGVDHLLSTFAILNDRD
ncbi:hypothetical protein Y032_0006g2782 [Ancylostoma ceylanicum]|uniref:Uncharacterized protein n=1 Tax=Ancylostoma ceylanicum TaxID=53326 RepID=A0A016VPZ8_9BILA|nr:hypothetical protein Y032_0006g2782 [Ancylostoma ceylanicum]